MKIEDAAVQLKRSAKEHSEAKSEIINYICKSLHDAGIDSTVTYRGDISHAFITIALGDDEIISDVHQLRAEGHKE